MTSSGLNHEFLAEDVEILESRNRQNYQALELFVHAVEELINEKSITDDHLMSITRDKKLFDFSFSDLYQTLLLFRIERLMKEPEKRQKLENTLGRDYGALLTCLDGSSGRLNPFDLRKDGRGRRMKLVLILASLGYSLQQTVRLGLGTSISGVALDLHRARRVCAADRFSRRAVKDDLLVHHISAQSFSIAGEAMRAPSKHIDLPADPRQDILSIGRKNKGESVRPTNPLLLRHTALLLSDSERSCQVNVVILDYSNRANLKKTVKPMSALGALKAEFPEKHFPSRSVARAPRVLLTDGNNDYFLYLQKDFQALATKYTENLSDLDSLVGQPPSTLVAPVDNIKDLLVFEEDDQ